MVSHYQYYYWKDTKFYEYFGLFSFGFRITFSIKLVLIIDASILITDIQISSCVYFAGPIVVSVSTPMEEILHPNFRSCGALKESSAHLHEAADITKELKDKHYEVPKLREITKKVNKIIGEYERLFHP